MYILIYRNCTSLIAETVHRSLPITSICNNGTITVNNPNCLLTNWTVVSGPTTIASGQGTNTITLQNSGNGQAVIRATAGGYIDEKTITIGTPVIGSNNPPLQIWYGNSTNYNNACNLQTTYTNMPVTGATSVTWSRLAASPSNTNWSQSGNNVNFYFWSVGQTAVFKINASNSCGTSTYSFGFKSINCGGGGGGCEQFKVSPNPATSSIKVIVPNIPPPCDISSTSKSKNGMSQRTITEIRLFDNAGNLKKIQQISKAKQVTIDLTGYKSGIYFVEILDGTYKERQQIIIIE